MTRCDLCGERVSADGGAIERHLLDRHGIASLDGVATGRGGLSVKAREELAYRLEQQVMSARVCGTLLLLGWAWWYRAGGEVHWGWGLLWPLVGAALFVYGFVQPLPKSAARVSPLGASATIGPGGAPTSWTPTAETTLHFSLGPTLTYLLVAAAMIPVGYALVRVQTAVVMLMGAGLLLGGVVGVPLLLFAGVGSGPCPLCGTKVEAHLRGAAGDLLCTGCDEYLVAERRRLRPVLQTRVAETPTFRVRLPWWDDLGVPISGTITLGGPQDYLQDALQKALLVRRIPTRSVDALWPPRCCVCGGPPTRHESLAREVNVGHAGKVGLVERKLVVTVDGIPHCDQHEHGVAMSPSAGECGRVLLFRSYWYRNAFRRANPWQIDWI
ncbi:MAG: hypothetical protein ACJ8GN_07955 [Longimicrobiaceae bacterium]